MTPTEVAPRSPARRWPHAMSRTGSSSAGESTQSLSPTQAWSIAITW